jgi:hypothetical protein
VVVDLAEHQAHQFGHEFLHHPLLRRRCVFFVLLFVAPNFFNSMKMAPTFMLMAGHRGVVLTLAV